MSYPGGAPTEKQLLAFWARFDSSARYTCAECGRVDQGYYVQPQHPYWTAGREDLALCGDCLGRHQHAAREARAAQLAARPKDCVRCGNRPHTFILAGWKLCGRCKTATMREHHASQATAGVLAIFATAPLVDTRGWAARTPRSA